MADKKLNEVTKVTDMAYVPVIMSDGSIGQIAKADLASVVAEMIPKEALTNLFFIRTENVDVNNCVQTGIYQTRTGATNSPVEWCLILVLTNPLIGSIVQLAVRIDNPAKTFVRTREGSTAAFTNWTSLT